MSAKTVVLLIQNVLTKKFIHFVSSKKAVEMQSNKLSKDNFILSGDGETHHIQVFSAPSCLLCVSSDAHLNLTDGASDVCTLPPGTTVGIMLFIEDVNGIRHYLRVNSLETNGEPVLQLVGQSFVDSTKESRDILQMQELKFDLVAVQSAKLQ